MSNWDPSPGNPYDSPAGVFSELGEEGQGGRISLKTVDLMRQIRPWALFVGVVSLVFGGLSIALAVSMLAFLDSDVRPELGVAAGVYFVSGFIQIIVGGAAARFAQRTAIFVASREAEHFDGALVSLRSFWRIVGTLAAMLIGLMVLALFVAMLAGPRA